MGSSVKSWVTSPIDAVTSAVKGDINGIIDAGARMGTAGAVGTNKGAIANTDDFTGVTAAKSAKDAAKKQAAQAQALLDEQKNAEANAQAKATAARRSAHANDSQTIYTTALGGFNASAADGNLKKKTLLGG